MLRTGNHLWFSCDLGVGILQCPFNLSYYVIRGLHPVTRPQQQTDHYKFLPPTPPISQH